MQIVFRSTSGESLGTAIWRMNNCLGHALLMAITGGQDYQTMQVYWNSLFISCLIIFNSQKQVHDKAWIQRNRMYIPSQRVGESGEWIFAKQLAILSQFLLTILIPLHSLFNSPPLPHLCVPLVSCWLADWYYILLLSFYRFSSFLEHTLITPILVNHFLPF